MQKHPAASRPMNIFRRLAALAIAAPAMAVTGPGGAFAQHAGHVAAPAALPIEVAAGMEVPPEIVNGCAVFVDWTADDARRTVHWDYGIESDPERCIKIRVGQTVIFDGEHDIHPMDAAGGDEPNPFAGAYATEEDTFTFTQAGVFGFRCVPHPEMRGAVWVVE